MSTNSGLTGPNLIKDKFISVNKYLCSQDYNLIRDQFISVNEYQGSQENNLIRDNS